MIILLGKMKKMPEVFPPTKIFIIKSDVKKYSISIDQTPFLET